MQQPRILQGVLSNQCPIQRYANCNRAVTSAEGLPGAHRRSKLQNCRIYPVKS